MPITLLEIGEEFTIARVTGDEKVIRHLSSLGLVVGQPVEVVSKTKGNLILKVKDSRIGLDSAMAKRIFI